MFKQNKIENNIRKELFQQDKFYRIVIRCVALWLNYVACSARVVQRTGLKSSSGVSDQPSVGSSPGLDTDVYFNKTLNHLLPSTECCKTE